MSARKIPNVLSTLMVSSGKGGVGKSTISANIAVGLARRGLKIGLLDMDIFGPSIPRLMGLCCNSSVKVTADNLFIPEQNFGVKCMSMGMLAPSGGPVVWRGLMVMKCIQDLLWRVEWQSLDCLLLDMPPGTGDTLLTVCQQLIIDQALIVTTPQLVAQNATEKGLLALRKFSVPILGIVENMKHVICPNCSHPVQLFSEHTSELAKRHNLKILSSFPMDPVVANNADSGSPITGGKNVPPEYQTLIDQIILTCKETVADR